MHILIIEPEARLDVEQAMSFYEGERTGLGQVFLLELGLLLERVAENPRQYQAYRRETRKAVMRRFPFVVLYRFDDAKVYVVGVMDGRQNPNSIRRRVGEN